MESTKDEIRSLLDRLPDDCTTEDVEYHLYVINKIKRGEHRGETEGWVDHEDVRARFSKWLTD